MELIERKEHRKLVRKDSRKLALGLLLYFGFQLIATIIYGIVACFTFMKDATEAELMSFFENSATGMIIGVVVGVVFLLLFFLPQKTHKQIFVKNKKMSLGWFAVLSCVFFSCQILCDPIFMLIEKLCNLIGLSAIASVEAATAGSSTVSMFIYAGLIGPIAEELVYRGFVMRHLSKYGKTFAIVASSIIFGVMHGNIPQAIFATAIGMVLGYIAMEYSIKWSILLHILNNLVLGDVLYFALKDTSELVQNIVTYSIVGVCSVIGLIAIIIKRKQILAYIKENKWNMPYIRWTFTTILMILYILINLGLGVLMLEKL